MPCSCTPSSKETAVVVLEPPEHRHPSPASKYEPLLSSATASNHCNKNNNNDDGGDNDNAGNNIDNSAAATSLQSNLSIKTLPSLPSLQISTFLATSSSSETTPVHFSAHYRLLSSLTPPRSAAASTSLAVSPDRLLLYSASNSGIAVYDISSLLLLDTFRPAGASGGAIKSLVFSPDGRVFTAHQDSKIRVWTTSTATIAKEPTDLPSPSPSAAASRDVRRHRHRLVASLPTVADRLRRFALPRNYVAVRRHRKRLWIEHADAVAALAVRDGLLYSVSWDKTLKIWRASDLRCLESVAAHEDAVNAVAVAADGTVYTGSADRRIRVWGLCKETEEEQENNSGGRRRRRRYGLVATLEKHRSAVNALALSADGKVLYSGACDRSILVWERGESADHMVVAGAIRGHGKAIMCLACMDSLLLSGSTDRTVRMWRRTVGGEYCCVGVLEGHVGGVRSLVGYRVGRIGGSDSSETNQSVEEYRVCSGGSDGEVRVWQVWLSHNSNINFNRNNAYSEAF